MFTEEITVNTEELNAAVKAAPKETRERWWVQMNCWECPADFPVPLPDFTDREREQFDDPVWSSAWRAVNAAVSREDASRAWWTLNLGKTEQEWREWWGSRGTVNGLEG